MAEPTAENQNSDDEVDEPALPAPPRRPTRITPFLIAERAGALSANGERLSSDDVAARVVTLTRLRLDRLGIADMDGLECCDAATHVYLQHNQISQIDGLPFLRAITFLCLDHNRIARVEGVGHLRALQYLGLAHNQIASVDVGELPASLRFLDLQDNPCCTSATYRESIASGLPGLLELDQVELERAGRSDDGGARENGRAWQALAGTDAAGGASRAAEQQCVDQHIEQLRAGLTDVKASLGGLREKKASILARAKERRREMRDLKHIAL